MNDNFFIQPQDPMQKRYEALRAAYVENLTNQQIADKFGYTLYSFKSLKRDAHNFIAADFFKPLKQGPKGALKKTLTSKDRIIELRKKNYAIVEIKEKLAQEDMPVSEPVIGNILKQEGFVKLFRRTHQERLAALQEDKKYPDKTDVALFGQYPQVSTSFGGIFLFLPLLLELRLNELFGMDGFYGSKIIPQNNYLYAYMALKLLGKQRLSHINDLSFDHGLGVFAGLNVLPKSTAISSYAYRHSPTLVRRLLNGFAKTLYQKTYLKGKNINLDFHSIPYYGEEAVIETNWVPTRGKRMQSVLSFFAQDLDTTFLCFSDGNIKNQAANDEILEFISFYEQSTGLLPQRLIFDSKLTTYKNLNQINTKNILFITLGRRGKNFDQKIKSINVWNTVKLDNVKRKYRDLKYSETTVELTDYQGSLRELIIKGTGRELPMRLITNDMKSTVKEIITIYSKRWRIENNIAENVDFFSLNALSSPVIVQVDFDIAMTLIANTLYKILAEKTKWLNQATPKTISRNIIDQRAHINIDKDNVIVTFANKTFNPVIKEWTEQLGDVHIPWWDNRKLIFKFE